jgi:hypothetical protein
MADPRTAPTRKLSPVRLPQNICRAVFCVSFLITATVGMTLMPQPAFAKDGGSGGGHGGSGGSGSGSSGGSGHDGGSSGSGSGSGGGSSSGGSGNSGRGGGSGGDDGNGHDSGSANSGHGNKDDRGERSGGWRDSSEGRKGDDRRSDVIWSDRTGNAVELRYGDGWSEAVRDSRYTLRDSSRRVVIDRPARRSDRARLEAGLP